MKRIFIIFISVILIMGAQQMEKAIITFVESLFLSDDTTQDAKHEHCVTGPPCHQQPVLVSSTPSPETKPEAICLYCDNKRECYNCDGLGIEFGPRFGISSGYGIDTLMDRVCFMCKGSGICSSCS